MWFMIRLSRDYTQLVRFTIVYKGLQSDKILLPATDTVLYVNLQTKGYNILLDNFFHETHRFEIDISQYTPKLIANNFEINVETGTLHDALSYNFKSNERIVSIIPVNLKVILEKAYTKRVPVILDADITYAKQYNLNHRVYFDPDSIIITASKELLKTIDYVKTEKASCQNLTSNTILSLNLLNKYNNLSIRYSSSSIKLFIPVAQYTEEFVEIPVTLDSVKENYKITTFPDKVKVYFFVNLPDSPNIKADSFSTAINAAEILNSKNTLTKVYLKHAPTIARVQRIEPEFVEYLIHK